MSKKKRQRRQSDAAKAPKKQQVPFVARPFEDLADEEELVAMMQLIPAATLTARLTEEHGGTEITFASLLPELAQGLKRADGEALIAMQTSLHSGDASRDVAAALQTTLGLEPGTGLTANALPEPGPRLQDMLDPSFDSEFTVHESFGFWLTAEQREDPDTMRVIEEAKGDIAPTEPVPGVEHAYWCAMNGKEFVRWVRGEDEDDFFNALARVHAARRSALEEGRALHRRLPRLRPGDPRVGAPPRHDRGRPHQAHAGDGQAPRRRARGRCPPGRRRPPRQGRHHLPPGQPLSR